jgi:hypothetical protein
MALLQSSIARHFMFFSSHLRKVLEGFICNGRPGFVVFQEFLVAAQAHGRA